MHAASGSLGKHLAGHRVPSSCHAEAQVEHSYSSNSPTSLIFPPKSVLPDVIVHRRGDSNSNLLVIEMKKASNRSGLDSDRKRLKAFRKELGYNLGALVVCRTGSCPKVHVEPCE